MSLQQQIEEKVAQLLDDQSLFVVDILVGKPGTNQRIQVLLDGDEGITIDKCASISRQLAAWMEEINLIDQAYTLEVSSPGLDHALKSERQYIKNIGRNVRLVMTDDSIIEGRLSDVKTDELVIQPLTKGKGKAAKIVTEDIFVARQDIKKTNVLVSFK